MKKKLLPIIIIVVTACILLGATGYFLFKSGSQEKEASLNADAILQTMVQTDTITTNLKSDGYIQLRFDIQTNSAKAKEELTKRSFQVQNIALRLASSMTAAEAQTPEGMQKFEDEMKKEINKTMQNGEVVKLYITNKIIH